MNDKEKVIEELERVANAIVDGYIHEPDRAVNAITDTIAMLKEQEAVVRCKDCKKEALCRRHWDKDEDWYCADGEPKDGDSK